MNTWYRIAVTLSAAISISCLAPGRSAAATSPPSVIFVLADDLGYGDLGCYGHPYARTPNIDRLASEGTRFRQFYSTGITCCPARTGLMTSRFPATFSTYPANGGFDGRVTITELLHNAGYRTGHFGKWHIGPEQKPGTYGIETIGAEGGKANGGKRSDPRGRDAHIFDDAIRFIEKNRGGPFYVNIWGHISHYPVNPPDTLVEKFRDLQVDETKFSPPMREKFALCKQQGGDVSDHMGRYLTDIYSLDEEVGRLLKRIDELGLRENTIVAFSSDQGPAPIRPAASPDEPKKKKRDKPTGGANDGVEIRLNAMGSSGELRGGKHGQYEGRVRVPFIVRWPGHVPAGRTDEQSVISGIDWLPTLCHIAGVKINPGDFEGEDVSQSWLGKGQHVRTNPLLWKTSSPNSDPAIRDGQWKLHGSHRPRGEVELYDVTVDPGENHDLVGERPDIVKTLNAKLAAWQATLPKEYIKADATDDAK